MPCFPPFCRTETACGLLLRRFTDIGQKRLAHVVVKARHPAAGSRKQCKPCPHDRVTAFLPQIVGERLCPGIAAVKLREEQQAAVLKEGRKGFRSSCLQSHKHGREQNLPATCPENRVLKLRQTAEEGIKEPVVLFFTQNSALAASYGAVSVPHLFQFGKALFQPVPLQPFRIFVQIRVSAPFIVLSVEQPSPQSPVYAHPSL